MAGPTDTAPAGASDFSGLRQRAIEALKQVDLRADINRDLYDYVLPYRESATLYNKGKTREEKIYDSTAPKAAMRFADRMQEAYTPTSSDDLTLEIGPLLAVQLNDDQKQQLTTELKHIGNMVVATLENSNFSLSAHEGYHDLFGGNMAILMREHVDDIAQFVAVPEIEIALVEDGMGKVTGIHWARDFKVCDLDALWPGGNFPDTVKQKAKTDPNHKVTIVQSNEWHAGRREWCFTVFGKDWDAKDGPIKPEDYKAVCDWLVPRFTKVPGEAKGRGPGLIMLPTTKVANKVVELTLRQAAFALFGLWTYRNDRIFNPKLARMVPGAMWQVSSNGGPMGESVKKMDMPGNFNISNIVLDDLRQQIKHIGYDDTLPPDAGAVRSPTEILERKARLQNDLQGILPRFRQEFVKPLVQWVIDVLFRRGLIKTRLQLTELLFRVKISSPLTQAKQSQQASNIVDWLSILKETVGEEALMLNAAVENVGTITGDLLNIPRELIRPPAEKQQLMQLVAQMVAAMQVQQQKQSGVPAGNPPPMASKPAAAAA